jgi:hypothetical protein
MSAVREEAQAHRRCASFRGTQAQQSNTDQQISFRNR